VHVAAFGEELLSAISNYGRREDPHGLPANPVEATTKRREPPAAVLDFYKPEEIEALAHAAAEALTRLRARGDHTSREDYVFCSRLGRRLDPSAVRRRFKAARDAAGLRPLRFHALRHAAGSLVARHADARFVQEFLGHSRITTTERYMHAKARPEDLERVNLAFAVRPSSEPARTEADR
jgi:site-specific recombinase XerD